MGALPAEKYFDAVHCRHAICANDAITQLRFSRLTLSWDSGGQSGQETSSPTADKRGAMHRKWRREEQQEKV